jgi:hypothetical protein
LPWAARSLAYGLGLPHVGGPADYRTQYSNSDHALVASLYHPIMLWGIGGSELVLNAALGVVLPELHRGEFAFSIAMEHLQLLPCLQLDRGLEILDLRWRLIFTGEESEPHVSAHIINKKQKILVTTWGCGCDWATQIAADELENRLGSPLCLCREWCVTLLAN